MYTVSVRRLMDHIKCLTLNLWLPRQQRLTTQATQNNKHFAHSKGVVLCAKQLWLIFVIHASIPLRYSFRLPALVPQYLGSCPLLCYLHMW